MKTTKPTGKGVRSTNISKAHEIDALINERASTRDINNSELDGDIEDADPTAELSSDEYEDTGEIVPAKQVLPPSPVVTARIIRPEQPIRTRTARPGMEVIERLTQVLDPSIQRQRDDQRAHRAMQTTQFALLSQQLRDGQATIKSLRSQVSDLQTRIISSESARERAELRLEMFQMSMGSFTRPPRYVAPSLPSSATRKVRTKRKHEEWLTDTDNLSEKENTPIPIHHCRPRRPRRSPSQTSSYYRSPPSNYRSSSPYLRGRTYRTVLRSPSSPDSSELSRCFGNAIKALSVTSLPSPHSTFSSKKLLSPILESTILESTTTDAMNIDTPDKAVECWFTPCFGGFFFQLTLVGPYKSLCHSELTLVSCYSPSL